MTTPRIALLGFSIECNRFAPVATRMRHWQVDLAAYGDDGTAAAYRDALLNEPLFLEWTTMAEADLAAG